MYLHPPMAERMFTLWREGKVIFGDVDLTLRGAILDVVSHGIWFLYGDNKEADFKEAEYKIRPDGIPVHKLIFKLGRLTAELEAFTSFELRPTCYMKLRVKNETDGQVDESVGMLLRTGKECELIPGAPDIYQSYSTNLDFWLSLPATFKKNGGLFRDGDYFVHINRPSRLKYSRKTGVATSALSLAPGEEESFTISFGLGEYERRSYNEEKKKTIAAWQTELSRINKLPDGIKNNPKALKQIKHQTAQLLQCFARPRGTDYVFARQGGLQRQIWVYETMPVLEALAKIGDFKEYIEPVFDTYFNTFLDKKTGEIVAFAIPWACTTGCALYSFATYAKVAGEEFYKKHRDGAIKAYKWVKTMRASVKEAPGVVAGLFPPMRSCDDPLEFQSWAFTDPQNISGLRALAEAAEMYSDPLADEIRAEHDGYVEVMMREWKKKVEKNGESNMMSFPISPAIPDEIIRAKFEFTPGFAFFTNYMNLPYEDAEKLLNYYTHTGVINKKLGLYDRMPDKNTAQSAKYNLDKNGKCVVYYVCSHEYQWFLYFMRNGKRDLAERILVTNQKVAMSKEYYMIERYHRDDPWFAPWSPNASSNGRTIIMLTDFYG